MERNDKKERIIRNVLLASSLIAAVCGAFLLADSIINSNHKDSLPLSLLLVCAANLITFFVNVRKKRQEKKIENKD